MPDAASTPNRKPRSATCKPPEIEGTCRRWGIALTRRSKAIQGVLADLGLSEADPDPSFYTDLALAHRQHTGS
jgi:hypothetical protein